MSPRCPPCHLCGEPSLKAITTYRHFSRVTSDSKPWPKAGRLFLCSVCGGIQKPLDLEWESEINSIYNSYSIYHQSAGGVEQSVFAPASGSPSPRSARLLDSLRSHIKLPENGKLLDVGCGNGAFLRAFSAALPSWSLRGTELNAKYQKEVESIEGVEALHVCSPDQVPGCFDLVTLIHVLEHIPKPQQFLADLRAKVDRGGIVIIHVPDYRRNPFDLLITDHITHFTKPTLLQTIQSAGYEIVSISDTWVPKELTVVARNMQQQSWRTDRAKRVSASDVITRLAWLDAVIASAKELSRSTPFGLFGTTIAATWLFTELEGQVRFFVDEDPSRADRDYMGRPVYRPAATPSGGHVFIALPEAFARTVQCRLEQVASQCVFHIPPPFRKVSTR